MGGDDCFTLREAAEVLNDPPFEEWQLELLVRALRISPQGTRTSYSPLGGRPPRTYPVGGPLGLMRLHTALAPWLAASSSG